MDSKKSIKTKIIALLDGELSQIELKELSEWIAGSNENARYYTEIKDLWEASLADSSRLAETEKEWSKFVSRVSKQRTKNQSIIKVDWTFWAKAAAILILGIIIGTIFVQNPFPQNPVYHTAIAPMGSVSKMILPDSTSIYLNAGSEIRYTVDDNRNNREVFLKGEAWFKVTHLNNNKPFVVHTPYYDVNVLGTEFNVKAYESDMVVTTTLEKGSVLVNGAENMQMAKNTILKPGEQLIYNKETKSIQLKAVNTRLFTSWKDNKLEFLKMSLKELIVLLERRYGVDIDVEDQVILNYHYSGTIKNETIMDILGIIEHTLPIHYEIKGQTIKIYKD